MNTFKIRKCYVKAALLLFEVKMINNGNKIFLSVLTHSQDLELLADGDLTVIGDRGATLSGGQKARVNLARLVFFAVSKIYKLSDFSD